MYEVLDEQEETTAKREKTALEKDQATRHTTGKTKHRVAQSCIRPCLSSQHREKLDNRPYSSNIQHSLPSRTKKDDDPLSFHFVTKKRNNLLKYKCNSLTIERTRVVITLLSLNFTRRLAGISSRMKRLDKTQFRVETQFQGTNVLPIFLSFSNVSTTSLICRAKLVEEIFISLSGFRFKQTFENKK